MLPQPACEGHDTRGRRYSKSTAVATVMLGRHSGIGSRIPGPRVFFDPGGMSRFPIPDWPGIGNQGFPVSPFGRGRSGIGVPGAVAGWGFPSLAQCHCKWPAGLPARSGAHAPPACQRQGAGAQVGATGRLGCPP
jgi:hypothetical protein